MASSSGWKLSCGLNEWATWREQQSGNLMQSEKPELITNLNEYERHRGRIRPKQLKGRGVLTLWDARCAGRGPRNTASGRREKDGNNGQACRSRSRK